MESGVARLCTTMSSMSGVYTRQRGDQYILSVLLETLPKLLVEPQHDKNLGFTLFTAFCNGSQTDSQMMTQWVRYISRSSCQKALRHTYVHLWPWLMHMREFKVHHGNREREDIFWWERLQMKPVSLVCLGTLAHCVSQESALCWCSYVCDPPKKPQCLSVLVLLSFPALY